ncbi:MAG TPA: transglycosylase domain-containing protein [Acidisarcina sp.]
MRRLLLVLVLCVIAVLLTGGLVFAYYYHKYGAVVDDRLSRPLFESTAQIYAAPREVRVGQKLSAASLTQELRAAGYGEEGHGGTPPIGSYSVGASSIAVHPGPQSYHAQDGATITFDKGLVTQLTGDTGQALAAYELEPVLITGLSEDKSRTKRRLVTYDELPQQLIQAVTSIEDRRFFEHGGVDYYSMAGWTWHDLRGDRHFAGGASTLTMQLAKMFFLTPEKTFKRKFIQVVITFQLEHRFNKQKIFEIYANQVPLGQRGSFGINGFGEAARAYFDKDVRQLNLPECAMLAGMIQSPSRLNPYRHGERVLERRNVVLDSMVETGAITKVLAENAKAAPLRLASNTTDAGEAPYFVDLVSEQLHQKLGESVNQGGLRIYTSLDPELQRAASAAVEMGMRNVDEIIAKAHTHKAKDGTITTTPSIRPQVALIALNPHTGQVLALVGGRNYGTSQLNHAVAQRPTGSIFKPFVYATAFNTSLAGTELPGLGVFTAVSKLNDEPTTFTFDNGNQTYSPRNYKDEFHGQVTAIKALAISLNNATISLGQMVGFGNVAALARDAGIKNARGTPSVALGSYDATPLDMAGAYTIFANEGVKIDPWLLASVRSADGSVLNDYSPDSKPVLDPRVAYLTTSLMEGVMNFGYGYEARKRGFMAPAAGKTGTSHDAWFAGYTSNLLCIVWIGNDDYTELGRALPGALAAAPIWAEFMKRAVEMPQYSDTREFVPPSGVVKVRLDKVTNLLANDTCPAAYDAAFLEGTAPTDTCDHANVDTRNLFQKIFGIGEAPKVLPPTADGQPAEPQQPIVQPQQFGAQPEQNSNSTSNGDVTAQPRKKKGFFGKIFGSKDKPQPQPPAPQAPPPQ